VPLTEYVAVVSLTSEVSTRNLMQAAAALQKQVTRDFTPSWGIPATVDAFEDLASVPSDYYHVVVFGDPRELADQLDVEIGEDRASALMTRFEREALQGIHLNAFTRQPFALVAASETWTVSLSHEVLELLADPFGNRLIAAAHPLNPNQRVKYLLEVCDPCLSAWYPVNGVPVSDFFTPRYFDPVRVDAIRYSYTGALEYPLHILDGGYLTWIDPSDSGLYEYRPGQPAPSLVASLEELAGNSVPLRTIVDSDPRTPRPNRETLKPAASAPAAADAGDAVLEASRGTALRTAQAALSLATGAG
jgi:hypothetical protein